MRHPLSTAHRLILVGVLAVGVLAATAIPGAAATRVKAPTFSGTCDFSSGLVVFSPGLTLAYVNHTDQINATGSCGSAGRGTLTGTVTGKANCAGGQTPATGHGTLTVGGQTIPLNITFAVTLPNGTITVEGSVSGRAIGATPFITPDNLGGMPGCAGRGLQNVQFTTKLGTSSPLTGPIPSTTSSQPAKKKKPTKKK